MHLHLRAADCGQNIRVALASRPHRLDVHSIILVGNGESLTNK